MSVLAVKESLELQKEVFLYVCLGLHTICTKYALRLQKLYYLLKACHHQNQI